MSDINESYLFKFHLDDQTISFILSFYLLDDLIPNTIQERERQKIIEIIWRKDRHKIYVNMYEIYKVKSKIINKIPFQNLSWSGDHKRLFCVFSPNKDIIIINIADYARQNLTKYKLSVKITFEFFFNRVSNEDKI